MKQECCESGVYMTVEIVNKASFAVIGILGQGLATEGYMWIPPLWDEANSKFDEIKELAKKDHEGNLVGLWGAMSGISGGFDPWTDQGKYLAGCEVNDQCDAPSGWTKWVLPSYKYAVITCNLDSYQQTFTYMTNEFLPSNDYSIVGAVHEFYKPTEDKGIVHLYFPIERR